MDKPLYLDYNATTPIDPRVAQAMLPYLEADFGNPSSSHWYGTRARRAVEKARTQVAALIGARPEEIVFTSGGTESNNLAVEGAALASRGRGNGIVATAVEHPAVLEACRALEARGFETLLLPVDGFGNSGSA
jgi:cysteine desulfurase